MSKRQSWQKLAVKGAIRVMMYRVVNDIVEMIFKKFEQLKNSKTLQK